MSADAPPISSTRFAAALADLSIGSLHAKAAELRNSIAHLRSSNQQLAEYLLEQDPSLPADSDCVGAIHENESVMARMEERIGLLKAEVEGRGMMWPADEEDAGAVERDEEEGRVDGHAPDRCGRLVNGDVNGVNGTTSGTSQAASAQNQSQTGEQRQQSGRLTDEELERRLRERLGDPDEGGDDREGGLHL